MIESLRALCALLEQPDRTADDVAREIGAITATSGIAVKVSPADASFKSATVVRLPDSNGVSHVELTLSQPVEPSELTKAFGESSTPPRLHAGDAPTHIYRSGDCRLLASVSEDGRVHEITLQNDVA